MRTQAHEVCGPSLVKRKTAVPLPAGKLLQQSGARARHLVADVATPCLALLVYPLPQLALDGVGTVPSWVPSAWVGTPSTFSLN